MLLCSLPMRLRGAGVMEGGVESWCVTCVVHLRLLRLQVLQWLRYSARRVTTLGHMLLLLVPRIFCRWLGPVT